MVLESLQFYPMRGRMKQALIRSGRVELAEVPTPVVGKGCILVSLEHSCISVGTEMSSVRSSATPLWKRALQQPGKIAWVFNALRTGGIARTRQLVGEKLSTAQATGYSAAGNVIAVGEGVESFVVGERVACAGGQCAFHAEVICVPINLSVHLGEKVTSIAASTVALGAIALQGVRRANPTLGETFVVIGLGLLGQITSQLLKANGCNVIGFDLDPSRIGKALELGMDAAIYPAADPPLDRVARLTSGVGVDGVIITAASASSEALSTAFRMCRKKGRVVLVGDVGIDINRSDIFAKELDFFISTSYGPGRYDVRYEEEGLDYPISYVRWTEQRNMQSYVDLINQGTLLIDPLISDIYPIDQVAEAYSSFTGSNRRPLAALLSYPGQPNCSNVMQSVDIVQAQKNRVIRLGLVGAGSFLKGTHLPNLCAQTDAFRLVAVVSRSGHNAAETSRQLSAPLAATDFSQVVGHPDIDAFIIATRHHLHATQVLEALRHGKHVLCEKPLVLTREELTKIQEFYAGPSTDASTPVLLTGFNRRFSPFAMRAAEVIKDRSHPMIINYRMCGGLTPPDHWIHGPEGGGRNMAEACHIYDLFTYLTGAKVRSVTATPIRSTSQEYTPKDNFSATISYEDGSVANLIYTVMGSKDYPKEQCEIFCEGKVIFIDDYHSLTVTGSKAKGLKVSRQDKGHDQELRAFSKCILQGGEWPIPLWQQLQAMEVALMVDSRLAGTKESACV